MQQEFDLVVRDDHRHDFNMLAKLYPQLKQHLLVFYGKTTVDFQKPEALLCLTSVLMHYLFGVKWTLPERHLCPRVPSRINYLTWAEQIYIRAFGRGIDHRIVDVGTGAGLIYPLIGARRFGWKFLATEIDAASVEHSRRLLQLNTPEPIARDQITIRQSNGELLTGLIDPKTTYSMTVCNPPFFEAEENSLSKMTDSEHHTEDGEYGFFFRLYDESLALPNVQIFTCLIGRQVSFYLIKRFLLEERKAGLVDRCFFGSLLQGSCRRFAIAWTISEAHYLRFSKMKSDTNRRDT